MTQTPAKTPSAAPTDTLTLFDQIRARYHRLIAPTQYSSPLGLTDKGFWQTQEMQLTTQFSGLDKYFYTAVQGVVDDPDFALQKDPSIYKKMMRDPQIFYCLAVRKSAVSSVPWTIVPPSDYMYDDRALELARQAEKRLKQIPRFNRLLENILDAILPGMSANELVWEHINKEYIVKEHLPISKDRIKFAVDGTPRLLSPKEPTRGQLIPPYKIIVHLFNATDGSWAEPSTVGYRYHGRGLADTPLYHYFYFKMMVLKFLLKSLERQGDPFKIFYTGSQNAALTAKLANIMAALHNDSVVGIPGKKGETEVDVIQPQRQTKDVFMMFIQYLDGLITRVILGQELMTELPAQGSYAAAQVHQTVFMMLNEQDKSSVSDTLNRTLMKYDAELNTPNVPAELRPQFSFKKSAGSDAGGFLDLVQKALSLGIEVSERQVREYTGLREPGEGERILHSPMIPTGRTAVEGSEKVNEKASRPNQVPALRE